MGYETPRNRTSAGEAPPTGNPAVKSGQESAGCRAGVERIGELSISLVSRVQETGAARTEAQTHSGASTPIVKTGEEQAGKVALTRSPRGRLPDRPLDFAACPRPDRAALRRTVSSLACLEAFDRIGLELPDTGAPGIATRRGKNRPLEASPVAPYKKTLNGWEPASFSLMNPAFCSFPTSPAHGHRRGKPLCSTICTNRIGSRPLALSPSLPEEGTSPSTSRSVVVISPVSISELSSKTSSGISGGPLFFCGMEEPSMGEEKSSISFVSIPDFTWNASRPMRQNSIRLNIFGIRPIVLSSILDQEPCRNYTGCFAIPSRRLDDHKSISGHVSMLRICRGNDDHFHYLCKPQ